MIPYSNLKLGEVRACSRETISHAEQTFQRFEQVGEALVDISEDTQNIFQFLAEMSGLDAEMKKVAESDQLLLNQLNREPTPEEEK